MTGASEQFRSHVGLKGSPDQGLGLENAKTKAGGEPMTVDREDMLHTTDPADTKVASTKTGERVDNAKKRRGKKTAAKKTAAKKTAAKRTAKKSTARKTAAAKKK